MSDTRFKPHVMTWSPDHVARFWDWRSVQDEDVYFSGMAGDALIGLVRSLRVPLSGRVLDFGCGKGHLLAKLCGNGVRCEGVDFSEDSVQAARERLEGLGCDAPVTAVQGLPTSLPRERFDTVFLVETIEHLLPGEIDRVLRELNRVLRPGGALVVTTPNEEDIDAHRTLCPECGAIFHPMQHVRAWSGDTLKTVLEGVGFRTLAVRSALLMGSWLQTRVATAGARLLKRKLPHLVVVAVKAKSVAPASEPPDRQRQPNDDRRETTQSAR